MGHYYVPQRYLRNFSIPGRPGEVWMFDKKTGMSRQAAIKAVAQQAGFYPPEVEEQLDRRVEQPGHAVIDKLLREQRISDEDRVDLSIYNNNDAETRPASAQKSLRSDPGDGERQQAADAADAHGTGDQTRGPLVGPRISRRGPRACMNGATNQVTLDEVKRILI